METTAIFRKDVISGKFWLEFEGKPAPEVITALKAEGWRWGGYRKQWYNNNRFAVVPACIQTQSTTPEACDYSSERAERLQGAATRAGERAEQAFERASSIAEQIPFGQPILIGHHSERHARADQKKIERAMNKGAAEFEKSSWLEGKAASSERHQEYKQTNAGLVARRVEKLEADLRRFERDAASYEPAPYFAYASIYTERTEATRLAALTEHNRKMGIVEAELEQARQQLTALGGNPAKTLNIEVGDIVQMGRTQAVVMQVNPKTLILKPSGYSTGYKCNRSVVTAIVQKAPSGYAEQKKAETKAAAKAKAETQTQFRPGDIVESAYNLNSEGALAEVISVGPKNLTVRRLDGYFKGHVDTWTRQRSLLRACALPVRVAQIKAELKAAKSPTTRRG